MFGHTSPVSRRGFLTVGAVGGLGLTLGDWFALRHAAAAENEYVSPPVKAQSVIHIFLPGGISAQESFDPKPLAPIEYRGELRAIPTKIAGEQFSELLPRTAGIADKLTVVRSLTHSEAAHERGVQNMLTGYRPSPALEFPSLGSIVSHEFGPRKNLPAYICVPNMPSPYAGPGYLSAAYAPFSLGDDPARNGFKVRDLNLPGGVDEARFTRRREALAAVNQSFVDRTQADGVAAMNSFYQRAFDLIGSESAREAFNIDAEDGKMRDRYGRHQAGQRMLMARRLVEAGARFVTLSYGGWDHHVQVTGNMRRLMPAFDQAFAALVSDLDERGLLDDTLVLVSTEFGRTPKLNQDGGRDHWAKVFSVVAAGGGMRRGMVVGSSGATATEPEDTPVSPEDLATTVLHQLGIPAEKELMAPGARPIEIVKGGQVRREMLT
ncbi:MAG: sulfatase [Planctomycetaceae bacterium]|nr:sulfatase [Planctomycetaceae bacterium]